MMLHLISSSSPISAYMQWIYLLVKAYLKLSYEKLLKMLAIIVSKT